MAIEKFDMGGKPGHSYWLTHDGETLTLNVGPDNMAHGEALSRLDRNRIRELLSWAGGENMVVTIMDGPMANEVRKASDELGISEQMIVWNAVKLFLEIGGIDH